MGKHLLLEKYPTRNGLAIPAMELELPKTPLDLSLGSETTNNHHDFWTERKFGREILFATLRNLETSQTELPRNVHRYIHDTYEPPALPRPYDAWQHILRSLEEGSRLQLKTPHGLIIEPITDVLLDRLHKQFKKLNRR